MQTGKVWIYCLLFVCFVCLFICLFVRIRIFPPKIKLAASNFARWFIGVLGRESPILGNFALPEAQNRTNRPARPCCNVMLLGGCDSHAYQVRAACGHRIGMCGYTSIPKDGWSCMENNVKTSVCGQLFVAVQILFNLSAAQREYFGSVALTTLYVSRAQLAHWVVCSGSVACFMHNSCF